VEIGLLVDVRADKGDQLKLDRVVNSLELTLLGHFLMELAVGKQTN